MNLQSIISGNNSEARGARDSYFEAFDSAMRLADRREAGPQFQEHLTRMEEFGSAAGIHANEIAYRRSTLLYSLTRGTRR